MDTVNGARGRVGIAAPSVLDPTRAPEGYSTLELLKLLSHEEVMRRYPQQPSDVAADLHACRSSQNYPAAKLRMGDALIAAAFIGTS